MTTRTPLTCDRGLRRQAIVASVVADVFQGRLRAGQHLVTQELAERFGVSHTPIREALITLQGIGVVDLHPNRGATVRQVTSRDVREICHVRRVLECEATRTACGRIGLRDLDALKRQFQKLAQPPGRRITQFIAEARASDNRLHDLIAASSGNAFLAKELDRLKLLYRVFRDVAWDQEEARNDHRRLSEEAVEHLAIVEALAAGDARRAARDMAHHIRMGARYWSRAIPVSVRHASP